LSYPLNLALENLSHNLSLPPYLLEVLVKGQNYMQKLALNISISLLEKEIVQVL